MGRAILLFALCVLPALVAAARPARTQFEVEGYVYCDHCRAGFETQKTTYIAGARVRLECKNRQTMELVYSKEATTDSSGTYKIRVSEDHQDQICDTMLVSSSRADCRSPSSGRDRARVVLTNNNGIASNKRYANSMGFEVEEPMSGCAEVLRQYKELDE
ncbi:pollen-specific protein C13-like [Mercurialis annua]|uniref:pollen-specific protein C13-like n=1 Tax=Mercurialis annua TaxID=3986 RepID=UPI00216000A4|nr:pollen-specific protein C13-like [Mercurialis annua]